ncbi:divalent-cation tolerance protein CutA [Haloarchaeobius sp. HRN-SO-5]|uniref:divalent-cation tolerance protein CutA n=1 Tax=Haloarchaeobius sp. HRN-SO-5 TaxID=3446118 RepID=UPI003EB88AA4
MVTVYVTAPPDAASNLADTLVERRLAACVNRVRCRSTYRWEDAVVDDAEEILLAKTTEDAYDDLVAAVRDAHPYDVPCIERFDEDDVLDVYAEWRADAVAPSDGDGSE